MKPGLRRALKWTGIVLGGLVLLLVLGLWAALKSDRVARWALHKAVAADTALGIARIHGDLGGPLALAGVHLRTASADITIDSLLFDWKPFGLLGRQVRIDSLHLVGLHVVIPDSTPASPQAGPPQRPSLPLGVVLHNTSARDITVEAPGGVRVDHGEARISGKATDYRLRASVDLSLPQFDSLPQFRTLHVGLAGSGDLTRLHLDTTVVPLLHGRVAANGDVTWWPGISWNLAVAGQGLEPGLVTADPSAWPGSIDLRAAVQGRKDSTGVYGSVTIDTVAGSLRGQPLAGNASLQLLGSTPDSTTALRISSLRAAWGSAHLALAGYAGDTLDITFRAGASRLATLMPNARGSLRAEGTLTGPRTAPRVAATATGDRLAYGTDSLAHARLRADAALAGPGPLNVQLTGTGASAGRMRADTIALAVRGSRDRHRVLFRARGPASTALVAARGGLRPGGWSGTIDTIQVRDAILGEWHLAQPAMLAVASGADTLSNMCLVSSDSTPARLCAAGHFATTDRFHLTASVDSFPLALVDSLLPDSLLGAREGLTGTISGKLEAAAAGGNLTANGGFHTAGTAFVYPLSPSDTALQQVVFDTATLVLSAGPDGVRSTLSLYFAAPDHSPVGHLTADAALPGYHNLHQAVATQAMQVRVTGEMVDLAVTRAFTSRLDSLTGDITLDARANGTVQAPTIQAELALKRITAWLGESRVARGSVTATLAGTLDDTRQVAGSLTVVPRGVIYEYPLAGVQQQIVMDSGGLRVTVDSGLHSELGLGFSDASHAALGTMEATLALPRYGRLGAPLGPQPVDFRFGVNLQNLTILQAMTAAYDTLNGRLALQGTVTGTVAAPTIRSTLAVNDLYAVLPQGAKLTGGLAGAVQADVAPDSTITGLLRLVPRQLAILGADTAGVDRVTLADTGLVVRVDSAGLRGDLTLRFSASDSLVGRVDGTLRMPRYTRVGSPLGPQPLQARVTGDVEDLGFLAGFSGQVDSLDGSARLDLQADGTVAHPQASGHLALDTVTARLPLLGVIYHDLNATAQADSSGALSLKLSVRSGPGQIRMEGSTPLHPTVATPAKLRMWGTGFEAINTPRVHALVSPKVDISVAGDSIDVGGTITLPLVAVHLTEMPESSVPPSGDVIFVGDTTSATPNTGWRIASHLEIVLGDSVTFQGFNFTTELGGRLLVAQSPGRTPTASGELVIQNGHYKAYGQDLTIEQGHVRFAGGPVTNPTLAIEATRTAQDSVVAGLRITGTLQRPEVNIFSTPAMPQDRALAYIVLGHAPGESSGSNGTLVNKAVNAAGLRGGNYLAKSVGSALGLSNAGIQTTGDLQQASFVAGKYLSPDLYVSYGIGLFSPISTIRIQYQITQHWTLQAERGGSTGADILYKTERGQIGSGGSVTAGAGVGTGP